MPNSLQTLDTSFPKVDSHQTAEENLNKVTNYLYMLLENLKYTLGNLGEDNFNRTELDSIAKMITEPVWASIADQDGNLHDLNITAQNLLSKITDAEGNISTLNQTAQVLQSNMSDINGNMSTLTETVTSFDIRIATAEGASSEALQTANGLTLSVTNGQDKSTLKLMSGSTVLSSKEIKINGMVTFSDLSGNSGSTIINGANIRTGTVSAEYIKLYGNMTVYLAKSSSAVGGYIGYTTSANDGSLGIHMSKLSADNNRCGEVIATENGSKLTFFDAGETDYTDDDTLNQVYAAKDNVGIGLKYGDSARFYYFARDSFRSDSKAYLGTANSLWGQIYSTNATISTSDRNRKHDIQYLPEKYLDLFDQLNPVRFKLDDGTSDRFHVGFIAQDVERAMAVAGVDSQEFGGFVKDIDEETGEDLYFLRYEEFIAILVAKIKELEGRIHGAD